MSKLMTLYMAFEAIAEGRLDIDEELCRANMVRILDKARALSGFVRLDMEGSDYTQRTLDMFKSLLAEYGRTDEPFEVTVMIRPRELSADLIEQLYEDYLADPASVSPAWAAPSRSSVSVELTFSLSIPGWVRHHAPHPNPAIQAAHS